MNNGLSDQGFVSLLTGIRKSEKVRSLDCSGNVMGEQSLLELANILGRSNPKERFAELSLNKMKTTSNYLNSLLEVMGNNCQLKKLGMAHLHFNEISIDWIKKIIKKGQNLYSLNISGSEMLSIHLKQILEILKKNRILEYVNLSWLPLGSQGDLTISALKEEMLSLLYAFIIRNKQLLHLDLSYSRINNHQYLSPQGIIAGMKKSKSLQCIHLTGNAITDKCQDQGLKELNGILMVYDKMKDELENFDLKTLKANNPFLKEKKVKPKVTPEEKLIVWKIRHTGELQFANTWIQY